MSTAKCACGSQAVWDQEAGGYVCIESGMKVWKHSSMILRMNAKNVRPLEVYEKVDEHGHNDIDAEGD